MNNTNVVIGDKRCLTPAKAGIDALLHLLEKAGYRIIGPTVVNQAIVYDEIKKAEELPIGWTNQVEAGSYRLKRRVKRLEDSSLFDFTVGPQSLKRYFFPPRQTLWKMTRSRKGMAIAEDKTAASVPLAFFGIRACELAAVSIQDRVFMGGKYSDRFYKEQREKAFFVAVNCTQAGGTCFCSSMKTGPKVKEGFDLAITELYENSGPTYIIEAGTERGLAILRELNTTEAGAAEIKSADEKISACASSMGRSIDTSLIKDVLYERMDHPHWNESGKRCLSCGNCTMVCPTCFCATVEDTTDLSGHTAERTRVWDSCFSLDYAYIHGGSVRPSIRSRYRQWLTHKFSSWVGQYGVFGCVGCGRCITWCPAGIDITEEAKAVLKETPFGRQEQERNEKEVV